MNLDTAIGIVFFVLAAVSYGAYRYASENVYLKYKEQRVGVRTKWWRR